MWQNHTFRNFFSLRCLIECWARALGNKNRRTALGRDSEKKACNFIYCFSRKLLLMRLSAFFLCHCLALCGCFVSWPALIEKLYVLHLANIFRFLPFSIYKKKHFSFAISYRLSASLRSFWMNSESWSVFASQITSQTTRFFSCYLFCFRPQKNSPLKQIFLVGLHSEFFSTLTFRFTFKLNFACFNLAENDFFSLSFNLVLPFFPPLNGLLFILMWKTKIFSEWCSNYANNVSASGAPIQENLCVR